MTLQSTTLRTWLGGALAALLLLLMAPADAHADNCGPLLDSKLSTLQQNGGHWKYELIVTNSTDVKFLFGSFAFNPNGSGPPNLFDAGGPYLYSDRDNPNVSSATPQPFDVNRADSVQVWWSESLGFNIWDSTHQTHIQWGARPTCIGNSMSIISGDTVYTLAFRAWTSK